MQSDSMQDSAKAQARLNAICRAADARKAEMDLDKAEATSDGAEAQDLRTRGQDLNRRSIARHGRKREREMHDAEANLESAEIVFKEESKEPASYSAEERDAQDAKMQSARNELGRVTQRREFEERTESPLSRAPERPNMQSESKMEALPQFTCTGCKVWVRQLIAPMNDCGISNGHYGDMSLLYNCDGDLCKCDEDDPQTEWCDVCSSCLTCSKYARGSEEDSEEDSDDRDS